MDKKHIVVLGAGFGGLRSAMLLSKRLRSLGLLDRYEIILVDRNDCHLYTPLLYKLAAAPESAPQCSYDTTSLIKGLSIRFVQSELGAIDLPNGDIHLATGEEIKAEYLVIALGSETNYFGIQGLKENALQLKAATHALQIREALVNAFAKKTAITVAVGGAGANGIELAAEIKLWALEEQKTNSTLKVNVTLVEAMPTILPGLDPKLVAIAAQRLTTLGVTVTTGAKIASVTNEKIMLDGGGEIPFDVLIWTGGIKSPDMLTALPLEKDARGSKPLAQNTMTCLPGTPDLKLYPMVYGLGDSICFMNAKTGRPVPAVARAAILQADVVVHNLVEEVMKNEKTGYSPTYENFTPSDYPYVIPIGEGWAVAKIGPIVFSGWPAVVFGKLIEIHYLMSIMSFGEAMAAWRKMA